MNWTKRLLVVALGGALIHLIWVLLAWVVASPVLPMPWLVYEQLALSPAPDLSKHLAVSLSRVALGIGVSLVLAIPLALLLFRSRRMGAMIESFVYLSYPIPKLTLLPIVMLLAGLGETTKVIMIVLIILFQLVIGLRDSLKKIPKDSLAVMTSLGAHMGQYLRHVYLPATLPDIFSALRVALGTAISVLFVTETYGTSTGMGYYIVDAWMRISYLEMYGGIVLLSLAGFLLFVLLDLLEHMLCPWRR